MYNTFRQGILSVKKKTFFCDRWIDFRERIKFRSVAELKIALIGQGVSVLALGRFIFLNLNVRRILTYSDGARIRSKTSLRALAS